MKTFFSIFFAILAAAAVIAVVESCNEGQREHKKTMRELRELHDSSNRLLRK